MVNTIEKEMPRSDFLIKLVKADRQGNQKLLESTVEAMAAEERAKQHHNLAERLLENLRSNFPLSIRAPEVTRMQDAGHGGLLFEVSPTRTLDELILPTVVRTACDELVEEHFRKDLLRSYDLEPRNRVLLVGPPGNGKTSLAEALANQLIAPLFVVRYEAVIGSFLGETSSRLRKLFDFVRTHSCVLFFDEFDTLGKERGDVHETGEIKRVVSSLLLQIDALPSNVIIVTATNHPELLDRAVWRRFQLRLELPPPTHAQAIEWLSKFELTLGEQLGVSARTVVEKLKPSSYSELQEFCIDIQRRYILSMPNSNLSGIVKERLAQWQKRVSQIV